MCDVFDNARKSTWSSPGGTGCVEVGMAGSVVGVRDTTQRDAGALAVGASDWTSFLADVKSGRYDL